MNTHTTHPAGFRLARMQGVVEADTPFGRLALKAAAADTDGRFSQIEFESGCGMAPPEHIHHQEDEALHVLEGLLTVWVGDERLDLGPGDYAFMPRGVRHSLLVRSERAHAVVTYAPAGLEQFFLDLAGAPGEQPLAPERALELMPLYGLEVTGPPRALAEDEPAGAG